jgi:hypothetical protein
MLQRQWRKEAVSSDAPKQQRNHLRGAISAICLVTSPKITA